MSPPFVTRRVVLVVCFALSTFAARARADDSKPLLAVLAKAEDKLCFVDPEAMKIVATVPTGHGPQKSPSPRTVRPLSSATTATRRRAIRSP